jgi:hypothetical protein
MCACAAFAAVCCCCRVLEQKEAAWRCGVHPPMTAAEVAAAQVGRCEMHELVLTRVSTSKPSVVLPTLIAQPSWQPY